MEKGFARIRKHVVIMQTELNAAESQWWESAKGIEAIAPRWLMNWLTDCAMLPWSAIFLTFCVALSARQTAPPADVLLLNGLVYTSNPYKPWAEAVAVRGMTLAAVGSTAELKTYEGPRTKVIDLAGHLLLPGVIDSHVHFFWGSDALQGLDLNGASTVAEVEERIARFAATHRSAKWIVGEGWTEGQFPPSGLPSKELLDKAVPDRPAVMIDVDHRTYWVNSKALQLAGITKETPNPRGKLVGRIVRDPNTGEPTGVLEEGASQLMERALPPLPHKERLRRLRMGLRFANELGITSMVNASGDLRELQTFDELRKGGQLTVRMTTAFAEELGERHTLSAGEFARFEEARRLYHDDWVKSNLVSFFADGLQETHEDVPLDRRTYRPGERSQIGYTRDELNRLYTDLDRRGFQIMTNTLGEEATRSVLDTYEGFEQGNGPRDRRPRIELINLPGPQDMTRFAKLRVIPTIHVWVPRYGVTRGLFELSMPPRNVRESVPRREIMSAGVLPALGSDWPCAELNPFVQMQRALTTETLDGNSPQSRDPEEQVKIEQLISAYTLGSAYAEFMENKLGSLIPGKLADLIVVSPNVFAIPAAEMSRARVELTMVGGRIVWRNGI